ncbi:pyridoxamine 5'-phosphate oxidase family protein [Polaromonas sp.]|nr:pyridoxamine 5'-phosphate oxidase family protein [Candidatus Saccharibacteria bacterium]
MHQTLSTLLHANEEKLSDRKQRIYDFLHQTPIGVLSSVNADGDPHGVVVYYSVDKKFLITFLTKAGTRKYDNLKHNNHVMLTVFEQQTQATAQITGEATEITDNYDINEVAERTLRASMKTSDGGIPPIMKLVAGEYVAFAIDPVQIRMAVYARPDSGDYAELFETLESFDLRDEYVLNN